MRFGPDIPARNHFKAKSPPPRNPGPGSILIQRPPFSNRLVITYSDQQSFTVSPYDENYRIRLTQAGLPKKGSEKDRLEKAINYAWSFRTVYFSMKGLDTMPKALATALDAARSRD